MGKKTKFILLIVAAFLLGVVLAVMDRFTNINLGIAPIMAGPILLIVVGSLASKKKDASKKTNNKSH